MLRLFLSALLLAGAAHGSTPWLLGQSPAGSGNGNRGGARGVIVAFGDSLTAGYRTPRDKSYPAFLQRELDRRGYAYSVINEGVSGNTSGNGLARIETVLRHKPDIVVVAFGGNDGLRVLPVDRMRLNLREMIARFQSEGIEVVLAGIKLPPNYGSQYGRAFENTFSDLAAELKLPFLPFIMEGVALNPALMQSDGIHPLAEGNRRLAMNVLEVLEPLLRQP